MNTTRNPVPPDKVLGLDGKLHPRRYPTPKERRARDRRILRLRARGRSIRAIADEIGVSIGTVANVIRAAEGQS